MRARVPRHTEEVAGGRLGASAQPPRAPGAPVRFASSQSAALPNRSIELFDPAGALQEGLRPFTAHRPLPDSLVLKRPVSARTHP